jgi:drug/metabolite transporter (DMT)-like permease
VLPGGLRWAALGVLVFSFSLPMTKIAVRGMAPIVASMGRASVAAVLALVVLVASRSQLPTRSQARRLLWVVGGVVFGFPLLTAYALHHTASSHGSVVNGLLPLVTAGFAVVRAGERPSGRYWACSAVGLLAVVGYVVHEGGRSIHAADVVLFGAVLAAAVGYTEGALLARELGGWQVISWALVIGAPISVTLAVVSAARDGVHATAGEWGAFAYTAVGSMFLGFFAWYAGLARAGIARAGQLQLAQPALAIVWGWPLLGERLTPAAIVTVAAVLVAVGVGRTAAVRPGMAAPAQRRPLALDPDPARATG